MTTKHTSPSGQPTLPETIYENALCTSSIQPNPILVGIVQEMHAEQLTSGIVNASLKEYAKSIDNKSDLAPEDTAHFEYYKEAAIKVGLIPDPILVRIVARRHMATLTPSLLIKAYLDFRTRYPQWCESQQEGDLPL